MMKWIHLVGSGHTKSAQAHVSHDGFSRRVLWHRQDQHVVQLRAVGRVRRRQARGVAPRVAPNVCQRALRPIHPAVGAAAL